MELANHAADLFEKQPPAEKRRLLDFVVQNSTWKNGELSATYRQPFDMLAESAAAGRAAEPPEGPKTALHEQWGE